MLCVFFINNSLRSEITGTGRDVFWSNTVLLVRMPVPFINKGTGENDMQSTFDNIKQILSEQYSLEVIGVEKTTVGAGSDTWFVTCRDGKYVMKYPAESEINHPNQEPQLCEYLNEQGIPVCQFLKNKQGEYLSTDTQEKIFHVQKFIPGKTYEWNNAPKWLLMEMAGLLGKIHTALKDYQDLPVGIGEQFFRFMTPQNALHSYEKSLLIAREQQDEEVISDLQYRIGLMQHFPAYNFDLQQLTCQGTHGDYFISQLLCGENKINAVIDWTTACVHPIVWEIVRSYTYAAPSCKDGRIDMEEFVEYVREYCRYAALTRYDLANMVYLFYYQMAVCDYYGQYYSAKADNRYIYLQQAQFFTKLLKWLEENADVLTAKLLQAM